MILVLKDSMPVSYVMYCKLFFGLNTRREIERGKAEAGEHHSIRTGCRLTPCSHICVAWELNCAVKNLCPAPAEVMRHFPVKAGSSPEHVVVLEEK